MKVDATNLSNISNKTTNANKINRVRALQRSQIFDIKTETILPVRVIKISVNK